MIFSPTSVSAPIIAPSVNIPTEQVARDNRVREQVIPPTQLNATERERVVSTEEKQLKKPSWDPSENPDYAILEDEQTQGEHPIYGKDDDLSRLAQALSIDTFSRDQGKGYTMRFKIPQEILDKLEELGEMERRRTVISYHYDQAAVPNMPSEILIII
ncbi:ATP-dependent Lon protease [Vibrio sp. Of7-15]|uniref:ATP-dependent Lon protease n=1 Tax=Vibrio sp. Of7-15 TaxID=2724879 RepID=UPI001EF2A09D|nr:ATP-dependent Lon protease [Vibrio sp. Of7-15]MCG7496788.1 ATP-dependent Lon protease [Vibrio sp. Of7-15]